LKEKKTIMNSRIQVALLVATLAVMVDSDDSDSDFVGIPSLIFGGSNECSCQNLFTGHCGVFQKETGCWDEPKDYCCAKNAGECCDPDAGPIVGVVIGIIAFILCTPPPRPLTLPLAFVLCTPPSSHTVVKYLNIVQSRSVK